jgi:hypothetical protein
MKKVSIAIVGALLLGGCTPPKVLTGHHFLDADKSIRIIMQQSDEDKKLFNIFMRVCDVQGTNTDANCKETKVLGNVNPGSVY